jgi:hypothetical protein
MINVVVLVVVNVWGCRIWVMGNGNPRRGCVAAPVVRPKSVGGWSNMDQPIVAYPDILKLTHLNL